MRYTSFPAKFHQANRAKFAKSIGSDAIAIFDTADVLRRPGDFEYPFRPDSDFYYLTGIDEPEAVLVLAPAHANERLREVLFIPQPSDFIALWAGKRLDLAEASSRSGVAAVMWLEELDSYLERLVSGYHTIYVGAGPSLKPGPVSPSARRAIFLKSNLPTHQIKSAVDILAGQRISKLPEEIEQIQRAIELTHRGLQKAWMSVQPGVREHELEADLVAGFMRAGATGLAFSPIIATGKNATVIHYSTDTTQLKSDELVLFDVGAESGYYAADISRTIPVGSSFAPRQRDIYDAVHAAQAIGIALHKPGASILSIDEAMRKVLLERSVKLGLLTAQQSASPDADSHLRQYYPHMSHHLGLDVHDPGSPGEILRPGMVVTCEPGLYIAEEGIGVRIEDVILITKTGCEVLSKDIPSSSAQVELVMKALKQ